MPHLLRGTYVEDSEILFYRSTFPPACPVAQERGGGRLQQVGAIVNLLFVHMCWL